MSAGIKFEFSDKSYKEIEGSKIQITRKLLAKHDINSLDVTAITITGMEEITGHVSDYPIFTKCKEITISSRTVNLSISCNAFCGLSSLELFSSDGAKVTISDHAFCDAHNLNILNLSKDITLKENAFVGLSNLKCLGIKGKFEKNSIITGNNKLSYINIMTEDNPFFDINGDICYAFGSLAPHGVLLVNNKSQLHTWFGNCNDTELYKRLTKYIPAGWYVCDNTTKLLPIGWTEEVFHSADSGVLFRPQNRDKENYYILLSSGEKYNIYVNELHSTIMSSIAFQKLLDYPFTKDSIQMYLTDKYQIYNPSIGDVCVSFYNLCFSGDGIKYSIIDYDDINIDNYYNYATFMIKCVDTDNSSDLRQNYAHPIFLSILKTMYEQTFMNILYDDFHNFPDTLEIDSDWEKIGSDDAIMFTIALDYDGISLLKMLTNKITETYNNLIKDEKSLGITPQTEIKMMKDHPMAVTKEYTLTYIKYLNKKFYIKKSFI